MDARAPRTRYYTASSLDGFLATVDHSLEWLLSRQIDQQGPFGYEAFIRDVGALAMGASTYQWVMEHDDPSGGGWAYGVPCWVFAHRTLPAPPEGADVRFTQEPVPVVHAEMARAAAGRDIWLVGGGDLVGQFADLGLLDEVIVSYAPVTLGSGAPLLPRRLELRLTDTARNGDFVCAAFDVVRV